MKPIYNREKNNFDMLNPIDCNFIKIYVTIIIVKL